MGRAAAITTVRRLLGVVWLGALAVVVLLALATNLGPNSGSRSSPSVAAP